MNGREVELMAGGGVRRSGTSQSVRVRLNFTEDTKFPEYRMLTELTMPSLKWVTATERSPEPHAC